MERGLVMREKTVWLKVKFDNWDKARSFIPDLGWSDCREMNRPTCFSAILLYRI